MREGEGGDARGRGERVLWSILTQAVYGLD